MTFNNLIKQRRKELGLNQKEIAAFVGVSEATVSRWESGEITDTKRERIGKLAKILQVSPSELIPDSDGEVVQMVPSDQTVSFGVIGDIAAGYELEALEESDDFLSERIEIPVSWLRGRPKSDYLIVRVTGDSMFPTYQDGDLVLVLRQTTMNHSGQIGAFVYDDNKVTLKRIEYVMGEDWVRLVPINPSFPPLMIEGEALEHCRVLGPVKKLVRDIRQ